MAEILVPLSVLRYPARFFSNKRCNFDVTDFKKTLLVTLYKSTKKAPKSTEAILGELIETHIV